MTISHTEITDNKILKDKKVSLRAIGKKYPIVNTRSVFNEYVGDFWALKDISFDIYQGEVLGIIGRNGSGKTTLLNIIAGTLSPTRGDISIAGKVRGLFNLGIGFQDELSGRENIFLNGAIIGAERKEIEDKLDAIIDFSELGEFVNMPLGSYSSGMRLRLTFSIIASLDFDILVVDEVLAVGDTLFQDKCYKRMMDFKRSGKTLIITTQGMDLIERLCDKAILLDHGKVLFEGKPYEAANKYRALLNTDKFYVGSVEKNMKLVENTKKWADGLSMSLWGKELGTKEAIIEKVMFIDKFRRHSIQVKTRDPLKIKVFFATKNDIKEPHFGVAIFRSDGAYCYGPNTLYDECYIPSIKCGKGFFEINYKELLLAPGEYRVSVAIWDKNEALAFDHHNGYYKLIVKGRTNWQKELLNIRYKINSLNFISKLIYPIQKKYKYPPDLSLFDNSWGKKLEPEGMGIRFVKLFNAYGEERKVFMTNEAARLIIDFINFKLKPNDGYLWVGIYRDDGVYCQGISAPLAGSSLDILFPQLPLLPGAYKISLGIWSTKEGRFLMYNHGFSHFRMVFNKHDHGTVYLTHKWSWCYKSNGRA